jgi:hypothetical protein
MEFAVSFVVEVALEKKIAEKYEGYWVDVFLCIIKVKSW